MAVADTAASTLIRRANLALSMPYVAPNGELETLIAKLFAEVLTLDHVGANDDFSELGGDSLLGEILSMLISERTGFSFEIPLLVEHGSPRRIIELLRANEVVWVSDRSRQGGNHLGSRVEVVCLQKGNDNTPLYCMPAITGSVTRYLELAKIIGADRPVYGIQIADRAQTGKLAAFASLRELAACMAAKLLAHHRDGPICLIGYSFGGHLAIELARQLVEHGELVPLVGIIDTMPPLASFAPAYRIYHFARNVGPWALTIANRITDAKQWVYFRNTILRKLRRQHKIHIQDWYQTLPEDRKNIVNQNLAIGRRYSFVGIYCGTIFLFRQRPSAAEFNHLFRPHQLEDYGWRRITRANVHVMYISGDHASCMCQPDVVHLANKLNLALDVALAASEKERVHYSQAS
jgi:thioesterase domain-containing protein